MLGLQFAVARSQSSFALLVFLGVPCIGRTSASTSLLRSSNKQCYAFHMARFSNEQPIQHLLYKGMVEHQFSP